MGNILVIGAILIDMVGIPSEENKEDMRNKIGKVTVTLGGVAYNVAVNLAVNKYKTKIFTCIKDKSPMESAIREDLRNHNISDEYLFYASESASEIGYEIGYVAIMDTDKNLKVGITNSRIEGEILDEELLINAISESSFVAIDTNLSTAQIEQICKICNTCNKRVLVNVVSDAKIHRIHNKKFSKKFEIVTLNAEEADALNIKNTENLNAEDITIICKELNSRYVCITQGKKGYVMLEENGNYKKQSTDIDTFVESMIGAGDALFSAFCASLYDNLSYYDNNTVLRITAWVRNVITSKESHLGARSFTLNNTRDKLLPSPSNVFIIHGHNENNKEQLRRLLSEELKLNPIILDEKINNGETIIEKFERVAKTCSYAFAIFTPDDIVEKENIKYYQPRPNVLFELGWFCSKLGRSKVCILCKGDIEIPSDLNGIARVKFNTKIQEAYFEIRRELGTR